MGETAVTAMDGQRTAGAGSCLTQRARPAPFCSHNIPKQDATRARTTHQQKTWNCALSNAFPARSEGYRSWPSCTHNPKVAGSNPAPATIDDEGLADAAAANPFVYPDFTQESVFGVTRISASERGGLVEFPRWKRLEQVRESAQSPLSHAYAATTVDSNAAPNLSNSALVSASSSFSIPMSSSGIRLSRTAAITRLISAAACAGV